MYLFIDTETTGVPRARSTTPVAVRGWPRLVEIAWAAYGEVGDCVAAEAHLVYPTDFAIPTAATRIHGISTSQAKSEGKPLGWVMERFLRVVDEHARVLVGHNLAFDQTVVGAEMCRLGHAREAVEKGFRTTRHLCLMTTSTTFCGIPGRFGRQKYPTLAELHRKLFGAEPRARHRAAADVEASARCFFRLQELGVIS